MNPTSVQTEPVRAIADARACLIDRGERLSIGEALELSELPDAQLGHLSALAHDVRLLYCGSEVELCSIISGKTGGCSEDCHFCSQSSKHESDVAPTALIPLAQVRRAAIESEASGSSEFCIIYAVRGPDDRLMDHVLACVDVVKEATDLYVACSVGVLTPEQAGRLASHGVHRYNHNLETARSHFSEICTTHTWEDRRQTCQNVLDAGMQLCCGAIVGVGETRRQRVELAFELAELGPHDVPINFLNPRPGTPFGDYELMSPAEALRTIALLRLVLPQATIRYGGGREITLGDLQAAGLKGGVNAMISGNYLTTLGQPHATDRSMLDGLGMPVRGKEQIL
ncbi:MAG: biotin synthase BioB [Thermoleophilaceae bacterium]|nr:biotin synthase BioB [Thermoleophilaceae bacterium]